MSWMARLEKRFSTLRRQWLIHIGWIRVDWLTMSLIQFLRDPALDGTAYGDIMMVNDYIGTWHGDLDQEGNGTYYCRQSG